MCKYKKSEVRPRAKGWPWVWPQWQEARTILRPQSPVVSSYVHLTIFTIENSNWYVIGCIRKLTQKAFSSYKSHPIIPSRKRVVVVRMSMSCKPLSFHTIFALFAQFSRLIWLDIPTSASHWAFLPRTYMNYPPLLDLILQNVPVLHKITLVRTQY